MNADLDAFVAALRGLPFEYFQNDCVLIAADWVIAKSGSDPLLELRAAEGPTADALTRDFHHELRPQRRQHQAAETQRRVDAQTTKPSNTPQRHDTTARIEVDSGEATAIP